MALIVAIEPNREQAAQIAIIVRGRIAAELVLADSAERALRELGDRIPDLILTPQLLSPRDDAAITDRLRELGEAATHVQTLTIPALATEQPKAETTRGRGLFAALRRQKAPSAGPGGCAPDVFAEQIAVYLERALEGRAKAGDAQQAPLTAPVLEPRFEPPVVEPRFEPAAPEPRFEPPTIEPRYDSPIFEPRVEAPIEPRFESPIFEPRFESPTLIAVLAVEPEPPALLQAVRVEDIGGDLTESVESIAETAVEPLPAIADVLTTPPIEVVPEPMVVAERDVAVEPPVTPGREPVPVPEISVEIVERTRAPKPAKPATKKRKKPAAEKDDWSFFDPGETRFAALIARLDEITRSDAVGHS